MSETPRHDDELLSPKEQKARREAADSKRKTIVYTIIGVICVIVVAALLIWNSGFFQSRAVAMTVDGVEYTAPQVNYFYREIYNQYAYFGSVDTSTPLDEQIYDEETGQTWDEFFRSYAEESLTTLTVLYQNAVAAGYSLTDEEIQAVEDELTNYRVTAISSGYSNLNSYLRAAYGPYMTADIFREMLQMQILATNYYNDQQESYSYSQDELEAYYDEHSDELDTFVHNTCFISGDVEYYDTEDEEEAMTQAKELADAMAADLEAGGDFAQLAQQYTEGQSNPNIYTDLAVPGSQLSSLYGSWLQDTARESGDVTVMESSAGTGYFVVQFVDRYLLTSDTVDLRHILIRAEVDDGADAPTQAQMDAAREEAEELLATWQSGEATEDSFAELANANSDDTGSNTNGGYYNAYRGQMIANFDSWIFDPARQPGDVGIVENDTEGSEGYHIIYYIGTDDPYWMQQADDALRTEDVGAWLEELTADVTVEQGSGMQYVG